VVQKTDRKLDGRTSDMKVRRLNDKGIRKFSDYLSNLRMGGIDQVPHNILTSPEFSEEIHWDVEIKRLPFKTRYKLGKYLSHKLSVCDEKLIRNDIGLWTWLALFYFDDLCPKDKDGKRQVRADENYILSKYPRKHHRHAIRTTWIYVKEYGKTVKFLFSNPLSKRGELTEQLTATHYFLKSRGIVEAAKELYADPDRDTWKRGAASKGQGVGRRFAAVLNQLDLTYDLFAMNKDEILEILPEEFSRFREKNL